ncbi:hypothetical protein [Nocardia sp. NBC_00511]|uniref:hypothetical protein n=1 Tax=Nocardia sp. NBC_00511 TaxID=2903591 RepID=UPI0030DF54C1
MTKPMVTITARDGHWGVTFAAYDAELVQALKAIIPHADRRWDRDAYEWVIAKGITKLAKEFERLGATVVRTKETPQAAPDWGSWGGTTEGSAQYWKQQYDAMRAAYQLREQAEAFRRASPSAATPGGGWADQLYAAVGASRVKLIHRLLADVLHPDKATGDTGLMQELNAARDRHRKAAA